VSDELAALASLITVYRSLFSGLFHNSSDSGQIFGSVHADGIEGDDNNGYGKPVFQGTKLFELFKLFQKPRREFGELLQESVAITIKAEMLMIGWNR
jgi:hypothetical protein